MTALGTGVRITVPASTANLGSGFDTLGMALALHDVVDCEVVDGPAGSAQVEVEGPGAGSVPTDERHLVVRVLHDALDELGVRAPALRLRCRNAIPHSRGLGSSAAAIVAGVAAAYGLAGAPLRDPANAVAALQLAASVEGHADNAAASLHGGMVIAWSDSHRYYAVRKEAHPDVCPVALVPEVESSTHATRGLLPEAVPHDDAVFAVSRAALAVHALTEAPELLLTATDDRLHQDYREPAWPASVDLLRLLREAGVPAAISGAGPTVLALPRRGELDETLATAASARGFRVLRLPVDRHGVRLTPLG